MLVLLFTSALVTALAGSSTFTLTDSQRQQTYTQMHGTHPPQWFASASEAAYAAALEYGQRLLYEEIGAKIYVDYVRSEPRYSFGAVIHGQDDPATGDAEIVYSMDETDGHDAVAGLWHEHPSGQTWTTLFGHDDDVATTKQAVWTTIGTNLFVQFWDGRQVVPAWNDEQAIPSLCSGCV